MPRSGVDIDRIVAVAVTIADEKGIDGVTLKEISKRLGVSSPSLYNHVNGLSELKEELSLYALELLKDYLIRAVIGRGGILALKEMGKAYIRFAREHTGLYETIQWMNIASDMRSSSMFSEVVQLVYDIAADMGEDETVASHIIRTVRSLAHGYACIESHGGFSHPSSVESSYAYAVDTFFAGLGARRELSVR